MSDRDELGVMWPEPYPQSPKILATPIGQIYSLYLLGEIKSPDNYMDWFHLIRHASTNDVIVFHVNSPGGSAATAIQFMRVMAESDAHIAVSVEGECMSAATMIFLAADSVEIADHSMFMFHNYSSLAAGKGGEMHAQITYMQDWSSTLLKDIYQDFLSDQEIDNILNNQDMWMSAEEVTKRLEKKIKANKRRAKQVQKAVKDAMKETQDDSNK